MSKHEINCIEPTIIIKLKGKNILRRKRSRLEMEEIFRWLDAIKIFVGGLSKIKNQEDCLYLITIYKLMTKAYHFIQLNKVWKNSRKPKENI